MRKDAPTSDQEHLLQLLKRIRANAALTQTELARYLEQPQSFVSKYESGERRLDVLELRQVCKALGLSLVDFSRQLEQALK